MSEPLLPSDSSKNSEGDGQGARPSLKAWERQEEETAPAYVAFCRYLYMPAAERSFSAAYRQETGKNQASPSGQWTGWYATHEWKTRAQAYDAYKAAEERARRESEQLDALVAFSAQQHKLNAAATEASILLLQKATEALKKVSVDDLAKQPALIPIFLRTAAATAATTSDAQARALAVDELLGHLNEQHDAIDAADNPEDEPEEMD